MGYEPRQKDRIQQDVKIYSLRLFLIRFLCLALASLSELGTPLLLATDLGLLRTKSVDYKKWFVVKEDYKPFFILVTKRVTV